MIGWAITYDLHEESAWHLTLQAAALLMLDGVEIGLALLVGPVGAAPHMLARLCWPWAGVLPVLPVLPVFPVLPVLPEEEPVASP
jgi:hypothetical protein